MGIDSIKRVINAICYHIKDKKGKIPEESNFELGILDPDYRIPECLKLLGRNPGKHDTIQYCVEDALKTRVDWQKTLNLKGVICEKIMRKIAI